MVSDRQPNKTTQRSELRQNIVRWGLPASIMIAYVGYFGPWVDHSAAGLVILGLDLAEYVKFLGEVRAGSVSMWREWFLLPAAVLSMGLTLVAVNRQLALPWFLRVPLLLASLLAALSMLPPAWSPEILFSAEFSKQTIMVILCLAMLATAPLFRHIPLTGFIATLALAALATTAGAARQFLIIKPAIDRVYGQPAAIGWGFYLYLLGAATIVMMTALAIRRRS